MANQYGGLFESLDDRMSIYLSIFISEAKNFSKIFDTKRTRNSLRHADSLGLLAVALEVRN